MQGTRAAAPGKGISLLNFTRLYITSVRPANAARALNPLDRRSCGSSTRPECTIQSAGSAPVSNSQARVGSR